MNLQQFHPQYTDHKSNWKLVRDLIKGEKTLKRNDLTIVSKFKLATNYLNTYLDDNNCLYLPMPNPDDFSDENLLRYAQYVQRAFLFNATSRTEAGMVGMVYAKETIVEMPPKMEYLETNADGSELGLEQQSSEVLSDILETGREGLLVDFPETNTATTEEQAQKLGMRASIVIYKTESIIDWATTKVGAAQVLSFVKLCEVRETRKEDYSIEKEMVYRCLMFDAMGNYIQRVYQESGLYVETMPKNSLGQPFKYIPFFFIGAVNNKPNITPAPLLDISTMNLHHYRDTADWQESSYMVGQPTPVFAGLTTQWLKDVFTDGEIKLGSRAGIPLPTGGSATLLQAAPNTMPQIGMEMKSKYMIALGARLISEGGQAETAEAAYIKHSGDASVLKIIVRNINQAYEDALAAVADFMGETGEYKFELNDEFLSSQMTSDELTALMDAWQKGAISKPVLDYKLVKGGIIQEEVDLEEMNEIIDANPVGLPAGTFGAFGQ